MLDCRFNEETLTMVPEFHHEASARVCVCVRNQVTGRNCAIASRDVLLVEDGSEKPACAVGGGGGVQHHGRCCGMYGDVWCVREEDVLRRMINSS